MSKPIKKSQKAKYFFNGIQRLSNPHILKNPAQSLQKSLSPIKDIQQKTKNNFYTYKFYLTSQIYPNFNMIANLFCLNCRINEFNQLILERMSSFLFEKQQINCSCFDNSPKAARRIFRTQSQHSSTNTNKDNKQISHRNQSEQGKNKKKSLKKQTPLSYADSGTEPKEKQQIQNDQLIPQMQIGPGHFVYKKQPRAIHLDSFQIGKFQNPKTQRIKPVNNLRINRAPIQFIQEPVIFQTSHQINNKIPISNIYSHRVIPNLQYERIITQEFQKDLFEFKAHMEQKKRSQDSTRIAKHNTKHEEHEKPQMKRNRSIQQSISANKISFYKLQAFKNQHQLQASNKISAYQLHQSTPARPSSYRNSAESFKGKQSISKRMKGKMLPKQIQSERDGSSTDSDQMSEVVGRGWDGLTEQRIELQELEQMTKQEKFNTETMVTQQSHIRNSEIKTLTDYSNSFISPKSHHTKNISFGGGHKYGVAGMSYQHINQFGKGKNPSHQKLPF